MPYTRLLLISVCLWGQVYAETSSAHNVDVTHKNGVYEINMAFEVQAPVASVREILTDFNHLTRLDPAIRESEILTQDSHFTRVRMLASDCVLLFCTDIRRVEDMSDDGKGGLSAQIVPQMSDFTYGITHWAFEAHGNTTQVSYTSVLKPDLWVPPLIGPAIFGNRIAHHIEILRDNLQKLAGEQTGSP